MQSEAALSEPIPLSLSPTEYRNIFSSLCDFHLMPYTALLEMKEGKKSPGHTGIKGSKWKYHGNATA